MLVFAQLSNLDWKTIMGTKKFNTCYTKYWHTSLWLHSNNLIWLNNLVRWNFIITPESVALKSSASSLGPARLGSSGLLALITECVHWQMGSSTPTTPSPPLPGQHSPFPQRQIPSSRVTHCEMGQKVTGMFWNEDPENWPSKEVDVKEATRGKGTDFPLGNRFPSSSCVVTSFYPSIIFFSPQAGWSLHKFIWNICCERQE